LFTAGLRGAWAESLPMRPQPNANFGCLPGTHEASEQPGILPTPFHREICET
jgi:hypothetical protein